MQLLEASVQVSLHLRLLIGNTVMSAEYHIEANMTKINTSSIKRAERWNSCPCFILITSYSRALESLHLEVDRARMSRSRYVYAHTCWKNELLWIRVWLLSDMTGTHTAGKKKGRLAEGEMIFISIWEWRVWHNWLLKWSTIWAKTGNTTLVSVASTGLSAEMQSTL